MTVLKHIFFTIIYVITLSFILYANNIAICWLIDNVISNLFEWFYNIHWVWKILLIFFGGYVVVAFILSTFKILTAVISGLINIIFPYNKVIGILSIVLCLWNIIALEIAFWPFLKFDFWIICMWLIISFFIVEVNLIFIFKNPKNE